MVRTSFRYANVMPSDVKQSHSAKPKVFPEQFFKVNAQSDHLPKPTEQVGKIMLRITYRINRK